MKSRLVSLETDVNSMLFKMFKIKEIDVDDRA